MESAAIAWVSEKAKIPLIGIKVVTDIVDSGVCTGEQFMANYEKAGESLSETLPKVCTFINGKSLSEL